MIIRIQGGGQYRLDGEAQQDLQALDERLFAAVGQGDAAEAHAVLVQALELIHTRGTALELSSLAASDLILPPADASLEETADLLRAEGLLA